MTRQEAFMEATEWMLEHAGSILAEALNQREEATLAAVDDVCGAMSHGHRCDVTGLHTRHVAENAGEGGADYAWEDPPAALARAGEQEAEACAEGEKAVQGEPASSGQEAIRLLHQAVNVLQWYAVDRSGSAIPVDGSLARAWLDAHPTIPAEGPTTPPPGEQGKGADAVADAERRAEAWRNTASAMLQIEIDHRGRERLRELFRAAEAFTRDAAASGRHTRPTADDLSLIIRGPLAPAQPAEHPAPLGCLGCEAEAHPEMDGAETWTGVHEPAFCKKPHPASGGEE